jgi:hypothetical protein
VRIPFPERVPLNRAALFALVLFAIQTAEGTALYFSTGCVVFILVATLAFNAGGGLTRAAGAYVGAYASMAVLIGVCYKALVGEPAQSNLLDPRTDIEVYVGGIVAMYAAVIVSSRFSRKTALLSGVLKESSMYRASVGCILFGAGASFAIALLGESALKLQSAFSQLNQLMPLGIIIGVMYEIRRSGGTRSANLTIALAAAYSFFFGIIGFSKQGMLSPYFCWLLPVCALRVRLSIYQMLSGLVFLFIAFHYLVPFSQYGRGAVPEGATTSQRIAIALPLLEHPERTRNLYYLQESSFGLADRGLSAYYSEPQGFWERLQMISPDDRLNDATDRGKVFGLLPIELAFINIIPHVLWPDKPGINYGNAYAHDITGEAQGEGDTATGISFSPTGEVYHLAKWTGVLLVAPLLWCAFFVVFDTLVGDLRSTPWGLLALSLICFIAPEGGITGLIYLLTFGVEAIVFCAFFASWFAPALATFVLGPERIKPGLPLPFQTLEPPPLR